SAVSPLARGADGSGGVTPLVPSSQRRRQAEAMALVDGTGGRLPIPGRAGPESGGIAPERPSPLHPPTAATTSSMAPAAYWAKRRRPDGRDVMTSIMPPSIGASPARVT